MTNTTNTINDVQRMSDGRYLLNNDVVIYNMVFGDTGVEYDVDYDPDRINSASADILANAFIAECITQT